jgi:hypothetical protein
MASSGCNYGEIEFENEIMVFQSINSDKVFDISLAKVSQCVIPGNNRNEVEIQFQDDNIDRESDCLVQMRVHFPSAPTQVDENGEIEVEDDVPTK